MNALFRHRPSLIVILVILGSWQTGLSQQLTYRFDHITPDNGLSQSTVLAITKDKAGFIWIATREGLNRYDGHRVTVYKHNSAISGSLPSNSVHSLLTDSRGTLWVGTNVGLLTYQPEKDVFTPISGLLSQASSPSNTNISCLLEDRHRQVWIGTRDGLAVLSPNQAKPIQRFLHKNQDAQSLPGNDIRSLFLDAAGTVWVGTSRGLVQVQPRRQGVYVFKTYYPQAADSLYQTSGNWVNAIAEDKSGRLWIGTEKSGLHRFDKKQGKFLPWATTDAPHLTNESVRSIALAKNGELWVGTINGLSIIDPVKNSVVVLKNNPADPGSLSDNSIKSIFIDPLGSYWIGTFYGGVNNYSPLAKPFGYLTLGNASSLPFKIASVLTIDPAKRLWIGTEDNGLFLTDANRQLIRHYEQGANSLSSNKIKSILPNGNRGIWVGTLKGLNYIDFRQNTVTRYLHKPGDSTSLPDDRLYDLKYDRKGQLWIATYWGGLCRFNSQNKTFQRFINQSNNQKSLSSSSSTCLFEDSQQRLWVGTQLGLNCKLPASVEFKRYMHRTTDTTSLSSNYIVCIYEDRQHRLWVGTRDKGLNEFLPHSQTFRRFMTADGLPGNTVYSIQEDAKGFLWLSTENGLARFDPNTWTCTNYDRTDGLVCKEFSANSSAHDEQGILYFGGYNGIVMFRPGDIQTNTNVPAMAFTQLRLFNKPVPITASSILTNQLNYTKSVTFDHTQNVFSVEFAALNYINSGKNRFAYKLANFDDNWNYVDEPVATYMNLDAGNYTLLVKAANNSGVWNPRPLSLSINVLPPPWKSWWAYLLYASGLGGLIYAWQRFRQTQLKLAHDLQIEQLEKEQQRQLNEAKLNFFADVAHELRTPLTLIVSPVEVLTDRHADDKYTQRHLSLISANTNRLLRLLNQLLDFQKQETGQVQLQLAEGDLVSFAEELTNSFRDYAQRRQLMLVFEATEPVIWLNFDRDELTKVLSNLLTNALKFTPANGQVVVTVGLSGNPARDAIITVTDNGIGISAAELPNIFNRFFQVGSSGNTKAGFGLGLALSKGIVERHGGTISVESREATLDERGFTRFTLSLPVLNTPALSASQRPVFNQPIAPVADDMVVTQSTEQELATPKERQVLLLVEDNEAIRHHLRSLFADTYFILEAVNGQQGWDIAIEKLPDLIISDVAMPEMDGLELTQRLKTDSRTQHIPVILLTAKGTLDHQVTGLGSGADDYIAKPFHPGVLRLKVQNLLVLREHIREKYRRIVTLDPQYEAVDDPDAVFLQRLMTVMEPNLADPDFNVSALTEEIGMSRPVLFRKIKMLTGLSVVELIRSLRMKKAQMLLSQKGMTVAEVAFNVGYNDPKYFSKQFRNEIGQSPTEYADSLI